MSWATTTSRRDEKAIRGRHFRRKGQGIEYEPVALALLRGTRVALLDRRDRWSRVDVTGTNDIEGWVYNKFLAELPPAPRVKPRATRKRKK